MMSTPDYFTDYDEADRAWCVANMTKWGRRNLAEFYGPGAEEWARKYEAWLWEQYASKVKTDG
jgi:hypothetical protein